MAGAIDAMRSAFGQLSSGQADMPQRINVDSKLGTTQVMPAFLSGSDDLAIKLNSIYRQNRSRGLPMINGIVTAIDPATGLPLAVMNSGCVTSLRTGAASGLATELLAREDSNILAVFGAGVQARTQAEAVCTVRAIKSVRVYAPTPDHVEAFISDVAGAGPIPADVQAAGSPREALDGATLVVAATTSSNPVFDGNDLQPGTHINAVGSWQPTMRELDERTVTRAKIIVDQRSATWEEAGELIAACDNGLIDDVHAELGELVNGARPGRESDDEITLFKSVGVAAQDAAVASAILRAAEEKDIGTSVEF